MCTTNCKFVEEQAKQDLFNSTKSNVDYKPGKQVIKDNRTTKEISKDIIEWLE